MVKSFELPVTPAATNFNAAIARFAERALYIGTLDTDIKNNRFLLADSGSKTLDDFN